MSEPMISICASESTDKSGSDRPRRWRFQFSIRSLLLFTLIIALALTSVLMYRRMADAERELVNLRNLVGFLKIDDENLFYVIALESNEPWTWRWRVYLPAGYKYGWYLGNGDISPDGKCNGTSSGVVDGSPVSKGTEAIVSIAIGKDLDDRWSLHLLCKATNGTYNRMTSGLIPDVIINKLKEMNVDEHIGRAKTETRKLDKQIILLNFRSCEKISDRSWNISSPDPRPGIIAWLKVAP
jgi:hypothetical protein